MNIRVLENFKNFNLDENDLVEITNSSYSFYLVNSKLKIDDDLKNNLTKQRAFSCLVRFYRSLNTNKKIEEEAFQNTLKEIFKGKSKFITIFNEKVQEIISVQANKITFTDKVIRRNLNYLSNYRGENSNTVSDFINNLSNNYHLLKNLSFKVIVTISNNISNRVLTPEIYLYITLDNGKTIEMLVEVKTFQELRKCLAFHIKKMIDNESVNLLK